MKKKYLKGAKTKFEVETKRVRTARALPELADLAAKKLEMLRSVLSELFTDENFVTLLEAESLTAIPAVLRSAFEEARNGHEIHQ